MSGGGIAVGLEGNIMLFVLGRLLLLPNIWWGWWPKLFTGILLIKWISSMSFSSKYFSVFGYTEYDDFNGLDSWYLDNGLFFYIDFLDNRLLNLNANN